MSNDTPLKRCCRCKIEKTLDCFGKDKNQSDKLQRQCKECFAQYYIANRQQRIDNQSIYRNEHKQEIAIYMSNYQQDNPHVIKANQHNRRARRVSAEGSHTAEEITALFNSQHSRCGWCGALLINPFTKVGNGDKANLDHVIALKHGGDNTVDNLLWSCERCNKSKNSKLLSEWIK